MKYFVIDKTLLRNIEDVANLTKSFVLLNHIPYPVIVELRDDIENLFIYGRVAVIVYSLAIVKYNPI